MRHLIWNSPVVNLEGQICSSSIGMADRKVILKMKCSSPTCKGQCMWWCCIWCSLWRKSIMVLWSIFLDIELPSLPPQWSVVFGFICLMPCTSVWAKCRFLWFRFSALSKKGFGSLHVHCILCVWFLCSVVVVFLQTKAVFMLCFCKKKLANQSHNKHGAHFETLRYTAA